MGRIRFLDMEHIAPMVAAGLGDAVDVPLFKRLGVNPRLSRASDNHGREKGYKRRVGHNSPLHIFP